MRTTKALAWAIKSRMSLVAASPLFNEGNDYWEEAYQINAAALKALTENGYELFTTCTDINTYGDGKGAAFRQIVASAADYAVTPRDKETIWQHAKTGLWDLYSIISGTLVILAVAWIIRLNVQRAPHRN